MVAAGGGQIASRDYAQLDGECLQQNRHQVGEQDDGKKGVIVFRAAGQVGRPVAGVHVAHRHQVSGAGESQEFAKETGRFRNRQDCGISQAGWDVLTA